MNRQFEKTSDNRGSNIIGLKGKDTTARSGSQVDVYAAKAKAIAGYVGTEFGHEKRTLVSQLKEPTFIEPLIPTEEERMIWSRDYGMYLKKKTWYEDQRAKEKTIILEQNEKPKKNRVESDSGNDKR
jgi:hypothetical protein